MACPIYFIDYSRISDTLMWLDNKRSLKFCVTLKRVDNDKETVFHREFSYRNGNTEMISILRNYNYYFLIEDKSNKTTGSIVLKPGDVELLKMLITNNIYPWFISNKSRIYDKNNDGRLIVKGKPSIQFPLSNQSYLEFRPIIIEFENTLEQKEGIRIVMNRAENFMDITIDKFLEFGYIINNTDMVNAAMNMLTYVKTQPYGVNLYDNNSNNNGYNNNYSKPKSSSSGKGFF